LYVFLIQIQTHQLNYSVSNNMLLIHFRDATKISRTNSLKPQSSLDSFVMVKRQIKVDRSWGTNTNPTIEVTDTAEVGIHISSRSPGGYVDANPNPLGTKVTPSRLQVDDLYPKRLEATWAKINW